MKSNVLKIVIIDSDPLMHETYNSYFEAYEDYELRARYTSVEEAIEDYDHTSPDIILSEVEFPGTTGIEGIDIFRKKDPQIKIIMLSVQSDVEVSKEAFKRGANGYLTKEVTEKRLSTAMDYLRHEGAALSNDIAKKVISMFQRKTYKSFSERENQIIDYLCQGATYKIIAEKLFVTTSAINFHIQNIYLKLNVNSKSEALTKLRQLEYA